MTTNAQEIDVHHRVTVPLGAQPAFELFTQRMGSYWPSSHSIGSSPLAAVVIEPQPGGRWYERGEDASECDWGRVSVWEPPGRVVLIWQLGADWRFDPDLETEVHVTFTEQPDGQTLLDLHHRHLERFGDGAQQMRAVFTSPGGWPGILDAYVGAATAT